MIALEGVILCRVFIYCGLKVLITAKLGITAQGFLGCCRYVSDNAKLVFVAVLKQERNIPLKLGFCFDYIITKQIIACYLQGICYIDNGFWLTQVVPVSILLKWVGETPTSSESFSWVNPAVNRAVFILFPIDL